MLNPQKPGGLKTMRALRTALEKHGCECILDHRTASLAGEEGGVPAADFAGEVDLAAVLGGDGTMMHAVSRFGKFE